VSIASTTTEGHVIQDIGFLSSILGGLPPYQYAWTFGDGSTDSVANPDYTYTTQGVFIPSLMVTDSAGTSASDSLNVMIGEPILKSLQILPLPVSLEVNQEHVFSVTGIFSDEMERDMSNQVEWMSSNPDVATIDRDTGLLTALQAGNTQVWALHAGVESNRVEVTVNPPLVRIDIQTPSMMLKIGESVSFEATGHYSDGGTRPLTAEVAWMSSNPDVATIAGGLLMALQAGNTQVWASHEGVESNRVEVTVNSPPPVNPLLVRIDIQIPSMMLKIGESVSFEATGHYSDGGTRPLTAEVAWMSSNPDVAMFDIGSRLAALRAGNTEVSASKDGFMSNKVNVTVEGSTPSVVGTTVPISSGTDDEGELRISPDIPPPGISYTHSEGPEPIDFLEVHVTWSNGFEEDVTSRVTWVSGDPSVATIEDSPDEPSLRNYPEAKRLNPKRNGQTTIELRLEGKPITTFRVEISGFSDNPPPDNPPPDNPPPDNPPPDNPPPDNPPPDNPPPDNPPPDNPPPDNPPPDNPPPDNPPPDNPPPDNPPPDAPPPDNPPPDALPSTKLRRAVLSDLDEYGDL
jgi:SWI/SNF-related matrix-associated actin-dependent regulator of chromatin subfamily A protein 2/4